MIRNGNFTCPLLPLRDTVVFPRSIVPLVVGRRNSVNAVKMASQNGHAIILLAQKKISTDQPEPTDLYFHGTIAQILQIDVQSGNDERLNILVESKRRVACKEVKVVNGVYMATGTVIKEEETHVNRYENLPSNIIKLFEKYAASYKRPSVDILNALRGIEDFGCLVDTIASHIRTSVQKKQKLLEMLSLRERYDFLIKLMQDETHSVKVEKDIHGLVKKQMEKNHREYYLNEKMKAIQRELGKIEGDEDDEFEDIHTKIVAADMPDEAREKCFAELKKLRIMSSLSAEASVIRGYLDWMIRVPWSKRSRIRTQIKKAEQILNRDHYGLEEIKEQVLEYLAVQQRVKKMHGPILCFVGAPGVGKTSLGASIARATNREFIRMSLGGVHDESEIRGHRRTYIGSMPGSIIQRMAKAKVKNPLFLLDEVDKMGMDYRGDPAAALLEVLDPEHSHAFSDHYLDVDFDLSEVMFICTANTLNIPPPLLDRMEVIRLSGYTENEKIAIGKKYLLPKQRKRHGLKTNEMKISPQTLLHIIRYYTREAGARNLERQISKICRKVVKKFTVDKSLTAISINKKNVQDYLGVAKYRIDLADRKNVVGNVNGLAWTPSGGELLRIEASVVSGKGRQKLTGSLGDVMKESIQAALTVARNRGQFIGIPSDFYEHHDFHIHVPEGATPKDGPSAGIGMCVSLISSLTKIPVFSDVAMTGEITLQGKILPVGGIKEKLLAAHRSNMKKVIIPQENGKDLADLPDEVKEKMDISLCTWIDQVLQISLQRQPTPLSDEEYVKGWKMYVESNRHVDRNVTH